MLMREITERQVWVEERSRFLNMAATPRDLGSVNVLEKKWTRLDTEVNLLQWFLSLNTVKIKRLKDLEVNTCWLKI